MSSLVPQAEAGHRLSRVHWGKKLLHQDPQKTCQDWVKRVAYMIIILRRMASKRMIERQERLKYDKLLKKAKPGGGYTKILAVGFSPHVETPSS